MNKLRAAGRGTSTPPMGKGSDAAKIGSETVKIGSEDLKAALGQ
jgi:hypothetical protein